MKWLYVLFCCIPFAAHAKSILIMGDSLSAGYGIDPNQGWVALLQRQLDLRAPNHHRVINASVSGETTSGGRARLPKLLQTYKPDIVVLELGGNDGLRGQPPDLMKQNLVQMIALSQTEHAKVILFGMQIPPNYGVAYTSAFKDVFKTVATQTKVAFVPFFLDGVAGHPDLIQADGIHPKVDGQPRMLQNALSVIEQVIK